MYDLNLLTDSSSRANFYVDHANDADFLERLSETVVAYIEANDTDKLPEHLCGPVSATFAFAWLHIIHSQPMDTLSMLMATDQLVGHAIHAVEVHNDAVAADVFDSCSDETTIGESYARLEAWVAKALWDDSDPDAFLASVAVLDMAEGPTLPDDAA